MVHFEQIHEGLDVSALAAQLDENSHLWGEQTARIGVGSPHAESTDIWLRFRDLDQYIARHGSDMAAFCDEHESVWLPPSQLLEASIPLVSEVLSIVGMSDLGGVLLTRLPAGGKIASHVDAGWHAEAHEKFYVPIKVRSGALFCFEEGNIEAQDGDIWRFRNDVPHWVVNESNEERISMIVCVKRTA